MISQVQFDWTISLGNIISLMIFVGGCFTFAVRVRADLIAAGKNFTTLEEKLGERVSDIKAEVKEIRMNMKELATVMITIARQDERMSYMQAEISELKTRRVKA